jgi:L-histidine Nalpha-methyltransferase
MQFHGSRTAYFWRSAVTKARKNSRRDELVSSRRIGDNLCMSSVAQVAIHPTQFPDAVRRDLLESLRTRRVNHKFHYDSIKQTNKWLALHEGYSPSRNDVDCAETYDAAFVCACERITAGSIHLIGLGCGGGQKDTSLLKLLRSRDIRVSYTPCDVSTAMVLVARKAALSVIGDVDCTPLVCDLVTAGSLQEILGARHPSLVTFFGMIPNFEPQEIMPKLSSLVRPNDWLLFSANLAPGADYAAGVRNVLPQYDNASTREWLLTFLLDLGVERDDGEIRFTIEDHADLKRIVARFHFTRHCTIKLDGVAFEFRVGEAIQLFFSYRYTSELVRAALAGHGLEVREQWITKSEEEGVFLCGRQ